VAGKSWTTKECAFLEKCCERGKSRSYVAKKLGRTVKAVKSQISRMGCGKKYKIWNTEDTNTLIYYWAIADIAFIAEKLDTTVHSVENKADSLGLGSIRKYYVSMAQLEKITGFQRTQLRQILVDLGFGLPRLPSRSSYTKMRTQQPDYLATLKKRKRRGREIAFSEEKAAEIIEAIKEMLG
jgi:hypothetical protein